MHEESGFIFYFERILRLLTMCIGSLYAGWILELSSEIPHESEEE